MAFLFPYAGCERARRLAPKPPKPPKLTSMTSTTPPLKAKPKPAKRIRKKRTLIAVAPENMPPKPPMMRQIMNEVCAEHGTLPGILVGEARDAALTVARRDYVVRCVQAGYSYSRIGRSLCRDHTTILYHWQQYQRGCSLEPLSKPEPAQLELELEPKQLELELKRTRQTEQLAEPIG